MAAVTRAFVAVGLPEDVRAALVDLQRTLEPGLPGARWVEPALRHLTLAFLGDVPDAALPALGQAVATAARGVPAFDLAVRGLGAFPDARRPRVLWAGLVGAGTDSHLAGLTALQRTVVAALHAAGHPPADDRFHPHVTLARLPDLRGRGRRPAPRPPADLTTLLDRHAGWSGGLFRVGEVVLYASRLAASGPTYTPLARGPLGQEPGTTGS